MKKWIFLICPTVMLGVFLVFYSADRKKAMIGAFSGNTALCKITEDLIFTDPYRMAELNRWTSPQLDAYAERWREQASATEGGGILLDRPPSEADANNADEDADGIADASEGTAIVTSRGSAPRSASSSTTSPTAASRSRNWMAN